MDICNVTKTLKVFFLFDEGLVLYHPNDIRGDSSQETLRMMSLCRGNYVSKSLKLIDLDEGRRK